MDSSQCITQLLRRHSNDIRTLFSINVCSHTHDCTRIIETVPTETNPQRESIVIPVDTRLPEPLIALVPESPIEELERLRALKPMDRMKHSDRITELKTLLEL